MEQAKPKAVIFDIDGTLAHMTGRIERLGKRAAPYADHTAYDDEVDEHVLEKLNFLKTKYKIVICSGRKDTSRAVLEKWLKDNDIHYDDLFMRDSTRKNEKGGMVSDVIIKEELYRQFIEPKYEVWEVYDDRDQVVNLWRNILHLKTYQVADGAF